jgi:autotransporter passenger strand-loop-strand repeat protein
VVSGGGSELVYATGSAIGTQVLSGGLLNDAAVTSSAVVSNGGVEIVYNGASAIGTQVQSGGLLVVAPGGTATGETGSGVVVASGVVALQAGQAAILDPASGTVLRTGASNMCSPRGSPMVRF